MTCLAVEDTYLMITPTDWNSGTEFDCTYCFNLMEIRISQNLMEISNKNIIEATKLLIQMKKKK